MKINFIRFNTVLLLLFLAAAVTGCGTFKKKDATKFRMHIETANPDPLGRSMAVEIGREGIFTMHVEKEPFLDEGHVMSASVVKSMAGFQVMLQFNRQGTWILEQYTTQARGQRMAIYGEFGKARWLAAPKISKTIKDGVFVFTPDTTLEEADRLVRGLNAVAKVTQENNP